MITPRTANDASPVVAADRPPLVLRQFTSPHGEELEEVACPLCGGADHAHELEAKDLLYGRPGHYRVVRCRGCDLRFVNPRPTFASLGTHYPDDYHCYAPPEDVPKLLRPLAESATRRQMMRRVKQVERTLGRIQPDWQLVDVGCGLNELLRLIRDERGPTGIGVDLKDTMIARARDKLKMPVVQGTLRDAALEAGRFDLVTMIEYLEHEPNPCGVLAEARRILKPGGHVALEIPNIDGWPARLFKDRWTNLDLPRHLIFFDRQTLVRALAQNGFELVSYRTFGLPLYIGLSVMFWLGREKFIEHQISTVLLSYACGLPFLPLLPWTPEFVFAVARAV